VKRAKTAFSDTGLTLDTAQESIERLDAVEARIRARVQVLGPETIVHDTSGWTVKDVLAHLAAWNWHQLKSVQAALNGTSFTISPFVMEAENWRIYREAFALPWRAVYAEWLASHEATRAMLRKLDDTQLKAHVTAPWDATLTIHALLDDAAGHAALHESDFAD
jgi:hypothetical protein